MADDELKVLKDISKKLEEQNNTEAQVKDMYETSMKAFPADRFKTLTEEQSKAVKDQRAQLKKAISIFDTLKDVTTSGEGTQSALTKFLGVDFKFEFFRSFASMREDSKAIKNILKGLKKSLALDKLGKKAGGFWDFLKKSLGLGLATVGFIKFIEGWNKADKYFENVPIDWTERLSSALASVIGGFLGMDENSIGALARDINGYVEWIANYLEKDLSILFKGMRDSLPPIKNIIQNIGELIGKEGDGNNDSFFGRMKEIYTSLSQVVSNLWESDIGKLIVILGGLKVGAGILAAAGKIGAVFLAIGKIAAVLGGGSMIAGAAPLVAAAGLIGGIINAIFNIGNRLSEFSQDWGSADSLGDKLMAVFKLVDRVIYDIADGIVKTLTFGMYDAKDVDAIASKMDAWVKQQFDTAVAGIQPIIDSLTGFLDKIVNFVSDSVDSILIKLGIKDDPEEVARAAEVARLDQQAIKSSRSYDEYLQTLAKMNENGQLTEEEYRRERREAESARTGLAFGLGGSNFNQFSQQQINNNMAIQLKPQPNQTVMDDGSADPAI